MNPSPSSVPKPGWSAARWIATLLVVFTIPVVILGAAALSFVTLDRDAALLRREMVAASHSRWNTKLQLSAGWATLATARIVTRFFEHEHADDVRAALAAVRRVSVGLYDRTRVGEASAEELFGGVDRAMRKRNWTRLAGVDDNGSTVLVYASASEDADDDIGVCVAVMNHEQLVVVSAVLKPDALAAMVGKCVPRHPLREKLARL